MLPLATTAVGAEQYLCRPGSGTTLTAIDFYQGYDGIYSYTPKVGDKTVGNTSGMVSYIQSISIASGTFAAGTAAGVVYVSPCDPPAAGSSGMFIVGETLSFYGAGSDAGSVATGKIENTSPGSGVVRSISVMCCEYESIGIIIHEQGDNNIEQDQPEVYEYNDDIDLDGTDRAHMRHLFSGVPIPKGATIISAHLLVLAGDDATDVITLDVAGHPDPNITVPQRNLSEFNEPIYNANWAHVLKRTSAHITWKITDEWVYYEQYQSPDLSAIAQEIIDSDDWAYGKNIMILLDVFGTVALGDYNWRIWHGYDADCDPDTEAPRLVITYKTK